MKKLMAVFAVLFAIQLLYAVGEIERQAAYEALDSVSESLPEDRFKGKRVTIYPFAGDELNLSERLENMLIKQGVTCVINRDDPEYNRIVEAQKMSAVPRALSDLEYLIKFGKMQNADIVIIGQMKSLYRINGDGMYAEIVLQAYDLLEKKYIWGGNFARRLYSGSNVEGLIGLDNDVKTALGEALDKAEVSLKNSKKLDVKQQIIVIPLAGDMKNYVTGRTVEMISKAGFTPVKADIPTWQIAASMIRDGEYKNHLLCYGSVRALHKTAPVKIRKGDQYITSHMVVAEIQLYIIDPISNNVLWTETVNDSKEVALAVEPVPGREKLKEIPDEIINDVAYNWKKIIWGMIIAIVVLVAIIGGIKLYFSYNRIR